MPDNGAAYRDTSPLIMSEAGWNFVDLGDASFTIGDPSAPGFVQLIRGLASESFLAFGGQPVGATLINGKQTTFVDPSLPTRFRFIPSPPQEGQFSTVDAVMMVDLPLVNSNGMPFATQPGASSSGAPVLIRNRNFQANPDINGAAAQGQGWTLERGSLPTGAQGFAISGDRSKPIYYVFTDTALFGEQNGGWIQIASNLISGRAFGGVFPNPYDSRVIYILTSDHAVLVSRGDSVAFQPDAELNSLIGNNATFINQITFNYDDPSSAAVCTQDGRLFFSSTPGVWRDLTKALPTPLIPISSVAMDCEAIYLGTFGRGLNRVLHYSQP
jgi:hypothetical protein